MKKILLITLGLSLWLCADFTRSGNIVTDSTTGLQWQDDAIGNTMMTWDSSINYCESLTLDSKSDWRLPNINELTLLVDDTKYNPSISTVFKNIESSGYWSSTTHDNYSDTAWFVYFLHGYQGNGDKSTSAYVRCVRAGQ